MYASEKNCIEVLLSHETNIHFKNYEGVDAFTIAKSIVREVLLKYATKGIPFYDFLYICPSLYQCSPSTLIKAGPSIR